MHSCKQAAGGRAARTHARTQASKHASTHAATRARRPQGTAASVTAPGRDSTGSPALACCGPGASHWDGATVERSPCSRGLPASHSDGATAERAPCSRGLPTAAAEGCPKSVATRPPQCSKGHAVGVVGSRRQCGQDRGRRRLAANHRSTQSLWNWCPQGSSRSSSPSSKWSRQRQHSCMGSAAASASDHGFVGNASKAATLNCSCGSSPVESKVGRTGLCLGQQQQSA
mmetsp:Transcript_81960/g.254410  ORF Transcript_81960/g.254410 Transcript_81960/m.254410 type:complete len:229 (-) Transcript_81960:499-1185(-)